MKSNPNKIKYVLFQGIVIMTSIIIALGIIECILRYKNSSMKNYDIEMWKYSLNLKVPSDNPILGHEHLPSKKSILQSVEIRTNEWGLRGDSVAQLSPKNRRILFLGSSVTLGWGVAEEKTTTQQLQKMFDKVGDSVEVLNAGIGNYNSVRYVERFLTRLSSLHPTDIVVHFFVRDAETLDAGRNNFILRNSQLAVSTWIAFSRFFSSKKIPLEEHYKKVYQPESHSYREMYNALRRLAEYAHQNNIRIYLVMTPDVHDLIDYKMQFIHDIMESVAKELRYKYLDLLPVLRNLTPQELWAMPGDPHPNALGHERMTKAIFPFLKVIP